MPKLSKADQEAKISTNEARRRKEVALAHLREMEAAQRAGMLLVASEVRKTWAEGFSALKDRILILPDRLAARLALRSMKGVDGITPINATPRFLLVPAALETAAEKYLSTIYPAQAANVNPFGGTNALTLVVDPRLDDKSAKRWYVFSDPTVLPCIEYAHLEGFEGVQIETRNGFDVDGVEIRARLDFGAGGIDFRGWHCNPGA